MDYINDDYCDCMDGTDEPGTSACSNGKFYCENAGHQAKVIDASKVMDGICDCCDGSDEGEGVCENLCWEEAKALVALIERDIERCEVGLRVKEERRVEVERLVLENEGKLKEIEDLLPGKQEILDGLDVEREEAKKAVDEKDAELYALYRPGIEESIEDDDEDEEAQDNNESDEDEDEDDEDDEVDVNELVREKIEENEERKALQESIIFSFNNLIRIG